MVAMTRSRGANVPTNSNDDKMVPDEKVSTNATEKPKSTKGKVYRKAPPKSELQQLQFPAKRKMVRAKKTRHSLPNPISATKKGKKDEEDEDLKQKTLTQMRWTDLVIPSTFRSDDEDLDDMGSEEEKLVVDLTADHNDEGTSELVPAKMSSVRKSSKTKKNGQSKRPAGLGKPTNRGRKRRKTTGDLELKLEVELEKEVDEEEEEVSSSKYHTQTLTQMPSWKGLADMAAGDLDEEIELGFGFDDELPAMSHLDGATPPSKNRKRALSTGEQEATGPQHALPHPTESSVTSSVIPETPSRQRTTRTEIPSSQPSPFTPNLDVGARYWSPLGVLGMDRTPLKERSTNLDAPTPTVRKRSRSEIPDSWSTVNGGMSSSARSTSAKRKPLKEIDLADVSVELGEDDRAEDAEFAEDQIGDQNSQRTADDVILDSDNEFEVFDDMIDAPGTSPPPKQPSEELTMHQTCKEQPFFEQTAEGSSEDEAEASMFLEVDTAAGRSALPASTRLNETQDTTAEAKCTDTNEVVFSTPAKQTTAPKKWITSIGSRTDTSDRMKQFEETVNPTPSVRKPATQYHPSQPAVTYRSSELEAEIATPIQTMRKTKTQQISSHPVAVRSPTPQAAGEGDETEPETPTRPRRRPSSSSAVEKETPLSSPQKTSPAMPPISQLGYKSQAFESQRVPFELLQQMAPQTIRSDVIVSADLDEVKHIIDGTYTHLFRDFRIPKHVVRIWIYIKMPVCQLKYMAAISDWKMPGDIDPDDQGIGTVEFNANEGTKYANELLQVYQLNNPVSLERMKEDGWVEEAPLGTTLNYVPPGPLGALMGNLRCALFEESSDESQSQSQSQSLGSVTVSQEVEEQLRSDIAHSTQSMRERPSFVLAKQRLQSGRHAEELHDDEQMIVPSSQDATEDRIRATPMRTKFSSKKQVVFAKLNAAPSRSQLSMVEIDDSPPVPRHCSQQSQRIVNSTVRPSQATTMSAPSQSQQGGRTAAYLTVPDSPSPARPSAAEKSSSLPTVVDDSPIPMRMTTSSGHESHTQSTLGLGALLASSQGFGLAGLGGEHDSLMDDSKIRLPPEVEDVIWDSE